MRLILNKKDKPIENFVFKKHIFKNLNKNKTLIITNFSEFGVETLACNYSIPILCRIYEDYKIIVVGWSGREYLYRHLADEFWELDEKFYYLKDHSNAFLNKSKDIVKLEEELSKYGKLITSGYLGNFFVAKVCKNCLNYWVEDNIQCSKCKSKNISLPILETLDKTISKEIPIPKFKGIKVPTNSVAIFARNRKTYGRNLPKEFYLKLNEMLKLKGYNPIYLGENSTSLNMEGCLDFSNKKEVKNLEFTLEILSKVKFSIQFWTASTRLAAITKTPYILVESPNQVAYYTQELKRIALTSDFDKKKIIICHYIDFLRDQESGLSLISNAIKEINSNNWDHMMGMVKNKEILHSIIKSNNLERW